MLSYLVQLSDPMKASAALAPQPHTPYMPETAQIAASIMRQTDILRSYRKHHDRYLNTRSDKDRHAFLDFFLGKHVVPMYQWYHLGHKSNLDEHEIRQLEDRFFHGQPCERGDIELHPVHGSVWLRIRRAHNRRLSVTLGGQHGPLVRIEHYPHGVTKTFDFPLVSRRPV